MKLRLEARVSSNSPDAVGRFLVAKLGATSVNAQWHRLDCTRRGRRRERPRREPRMLSELRRVERKTRLRAEWTAGGSVERFFDYVPKGTRPAGQ